MPTLNRFPLLGLWAKEAALRLGYSDPDAETLGHAYAVLYAIRANSPAKGPAYKDKEVARAAEEKVKEAPDIEMLDFGGDELQVSRDRSGRLVGHVGNAVPQTPESYRYKVRSKFPAEYYAKLEKAFRDVLAPLTPDKLNSRAVYTLYDQWKKQCASGRLVDLDKLIKWCADRTPKAPAGEAEA